jgi:hypothetical protein
MISAKLLVVEDTNEPNDEQKSLRHLGDMSFSAMPAIGDTICVPYDYELNYLKVRQVRHWPIPDPFVVDERIPNTQQREPFVQVIAEWVSSE